MAAIHGASLAGGRVFTATSGPGTLRAMEMFPVWVYDMAKAAGCAYAARVTVANPFKLEKAVQRAILISRAVGPAYVQIYTPCPTNMKFPSNETINVAREAEKDYYFFDEYFSKEAENHLITQSV